MIIMEEIVERTSIPRILECTYLLSSKSKAAHSSAELIVRYIFSGPNSVTEGMTPGTKNELSISASALSLAGSSNLILKVRERLTEFWFSEEEAAEAVGLAVTVDTERGDVPILGTIDFMQWCTRER